MAAWEETGLGIANKQEPEPFGVREDIGNLNTLECKGKQIQPGEVGEKEGYIVLENGEVKSLGE